jgi:hypothetical protein
VLNLSLDGLSKNFTLKTIKFKTYVFPLNTVAKIRWVYVPDEQLSNNVSEDLERIFYWGQNDFQPQETPSLRVNDLIDPCGFTEVVTGESV